eukprot:12294296-Alexandrium_andersonii.AAC.1
MLAVPGLLHIVHNASNDLLMCMPSLEESVDALAVVCRFISNKTNRERVVALLFDTPQGRPFKAKVERFFVKVHKARWGSVAFATEAMLELE